MFTLFLVISFLIAILCAFLANIKYELEEIFVSIGVIFGVISFVFLLTEVFLVIDVVDGSKSKEVIAMYEQENDEIENRIAEIVNNYMQYETGTFQEFKPDEAIAIVSLYPELKSDELVSKQIDIYVSNNEKIKELKETDIRLSTKKWLLYFGR